MSKLDLSKLSKSVSKALTKHSPEILTGLGIAGMFTAVGLAIGATPKAIELINRELDRREDESNGEKIEPLTKAEVVKTCWKCYIPVAVTCAASTACLIGSSKVNYKRNAALATAYTLSETALKEYQDKVVETIGEKKEQEVQDKIVKEHMAKEPLVNREVFITGKGQTRFFDVHSGRRFMSDIETIRKIENDLNYRLRDEMFITLNEFYYEIGLTYTDLGEQMGWNIDRGPIEIDFSAQIDDDGEPCIAIRHRNAPKYDYNH